MTSRLFVAVWPPDRVLDAIDALERPEVAGLRWTTREQWHITLRFLGACDEAAAVIALAGVVAPASDAVLGPGATALGRQHVVVRVTGLARVAAGVSAAFAGVGAHVEERPFRGHLTLARARRGTSPGAVRSAAAALAPVHASWSAEEVALVVSELRPGGSVYATLAVVGLGPPVPSPP